VAQLVTQTGKSNPDESKDYFAICEGRKSQYKRKMKPKFFFYKSATTSRPLRGAYLKPPALLVVADFPFSS
jgi:hypothetical protein